MKNNSILNSLVVLMFCVMLTMTIVSTFKFHKLKVCNQNISDVYKPNKLNRVLMTKLSDFVSIDSDGIEFMFNQRIFNPSLVLVLSEEFCPQCVETIVDKYLNCSGAKPSLYVVFNNISLRELSFRQSVFKDIPCFSSLTSIEQSLSSHSLFYVDENRYILNAIFLDDVSHVGEDDFEYFFNNVNLQYNGI